MVILFLATYFGPDLVGWDICFQWHASICYQFSQITAHSFFLKFCMKLYDHRGREVTGPDFLGKLSFVSYGAKRVLKCPKMCNKFVHISHYVLAGTIQRLLVPKISNN